MNYEKVLWEYLISLGFTEQAAAGIMGNTHAESANRPDNLQNSGNTRLNMTDDQYTKAVDNGTYSAQSFIHDQQGYGLCQWTYWSRKKALLDMAKKKCKSISDIYIQADYMVKELKQYGIYKKIVSSKDIKYVTKVILLEFEKPASVLRKTEEEVQTVIDDRYMYANVIYNKYHNTLSDDLSTLEKFNVINSSKYWEVHADDILYLRDLYHNMAKVLKQISEESA